LRPQFSAASRADGLTASLSLTFRHRAPPPGAGVKAKPCGSCATLTPLVAVARLILPAPRECRFPAPPRELLLSPFFGGPGRRLELHSSKASCHSAPASIKLGGIIVPKLTIEELGRRYACQLGHADYPATDSCPYSRLKSSGLYTSYWNGWDAAGAEFWRDLRCANQVA